MVVWCVCEGFLVGCRAVSWCLIRPQYVVCALVRVRVFVCCQLVRMSVGTRACGWYSEGGVGTWGVALDAGRGTGWHIVVTHSEDELRTTTLTHSSPTFSEIQTQLRSCDTHAHSRTHLIFTHSSTRFLHSPLTHNGCVSVRVRRGPGAHACVVDVLHIKGCNWYISAAHPRGGGIVCQRWAQCWPAEPRERTTVPKHTWYAHIQRTKRKGPPPNII